MKCLECGYEKGIHDDPRTPPLETEPCLCADCFEMALTDCLEEAYENVAFYEETLKSLNC